jgi:hypothetical protein
MIWNRVCRIILKINLLQPVIRVPLQLGHYYLQIQSLLYLDPLWSSLTDSLCLNNSGQLSLAEAIAIYSRPMCSNSIKPCVYFVRVSTVTS